MGPPLGRRFHDRDGNPLVGASFLLLFNAHHEPLTFTIPAHLGDRWTMVIGSDPAAQHSDASSADDELSLEGRSLLVLKRA